MEDSTANFQHLGATSKLLLQRLLNIGENRLELLAVEVQEERQRLVLAIMFVFGVAAFGLLAGMTLTAVIVVLLWPYCPVGILLILTVIYGGACVYLSRRLSGLLRNWQTFSASLDQLRKDRECMEKILI